MIADFYEFLKRLNKLRKILVPTAGCTLSLGGEQDGQELGEILFAVIGAVAAAWKLSKWSSEYCICSRDVSCNFDVVYIQLPTNGLTTPSLSHEWRYCSVSNKERT